MEWLAQNWMWIAGGVLILILMFIFTRPQGKKAASQSTEAKLAAFIITKLVEALEEVVGDAVGQNYSHTDRQTIATGMLVIMTAEKIPLERVHSDKVLFVAIMLKSIAFLTESGQISKL